MDCINFIKNCSIQQLLFVASGSICLIGLFLSMLLYITCVSSYHVSWGYICLFDRQALHKKSILHK